MAEPGRRRSDRTTRRLRFAALIALYFVTARLGLALALVNPSATAVWAPSGISLAALLLWGSDAWPAVYIGAFAANIATAGTVLTSLAIAAGNTLEAVVGAYLVNRFAGGRDAFARLRYVLRFAVIAGVVAPAVSATIGVSTLVAAGMAARRDFAPIWPVWWMGDAIGALTIAPAILVWVREPRIVWRWKRAAEVGLLLAALIAMAFVAFGSSSLLAVAHDPVDFLCTPFLVWVAYRFGPRETTLGTILLAGIAIWGTRHGHGPFVRRTTNASLLLLESYVGVMSVMCLLVTTLATERRRAEDRWRHQAVVDPLTGLANYRHLMDALRIEIARDPRARGGFAMVFVDVDGLKRINDTHGHVAGSGALQRVARVLADSTRELDTAARYGGDEFAVVLPETDEATAGQIAERIRSAVERAPGVPPVTVSVGVGVFPRDGATVEALIGAADRVLYQAKARLRVDASGASG
ncbi:MAG: MASE1 domain-containing protein [Gemmatimonadota bacterium]|nr:MASE1 domain-containing protein [Gemmatimonadota bacterium]MDE3174313.1 MASE1 domain-containing protein [Gemmatimonadota bacterium]MDE3216282.1 MASE1 domain-containing protein [Gemmatimonadota bacterium]